MCFFNVNNLPVITYHSVVFHHCCSIVVTLEAKSKHVVNDNFTLTE